MEKFNKVSLTREYKIGFDDGFEGRLTEDLKDNENYKLGKAQGEDAASDHYNSFEYSQS